MADEAHESESLTERLAAAERRIEWLEQAVARLTLHHDAGRPQPALPQMSGLPRGATPDVGAHHARLKRP